MGDESPAENFRRIRAALPPDVQIVVAAKGRLGREIAEVVRAGSTLIGENYVQDAQRHYAELGELTGEVEWHLIGHLQRNKINQALPLFKMIQSLDSTRLARGLNKRADEPVSTLVEVNIAGEESKQGVPPAGVGDLLKEVADLERLRVEGLMTMEPYSEDPEDARPYFRRMRELFEHLKQFDSPNVRMQTLSMGMTNSYEVAVEEGANMVRLGTAIFGPRR